MERTYRYDDQLLIVPELEHLALLELTENRGTHGSIFHLSLYYKDGTKFTIFVGDDCEFSHDVFDMIIEDLVEDKMVDLDRIENERKML